MKGWLRLTVIEAVDLPPADSDGLADPFVRILWRGREYRTATLRKTLNPRWNFVTDLPYDGDTATAGGCRMILRITDQDWWTSDHMGTVTIDIQRMAPNSQSDGWYTLDGGKGKLHLRFFLWGCNAPAPRPTNPHGPQVLYPATAPGRPQHPQQHAYPSAAQGVPSVSPLLPGAGHHHAGTTTTPSGHSPISINGSPCTLTHSPPHKPPAIQGTHYCVTVEHTPPQPQHAQMSPGAAHFFDTGKDDGIFADIPVEKIEQATAAEPAGTAQIVSDIHKAMPKCTISEILDALKRNNFNKKLAMDHLYDGLMILAADHEETKKLFATAVYDMWGVESHGSHLEQFLPETKGYDSPKRKLGQVAAAIVAPETVIPHSGRRKALLIGINYAGSKEELRGCVNDLDRVKKVLTHAYGFPESPQQMLVLTDCGEGPKLLPTKSNILAALIWLTHDAQEGDALFFHFSGHGSQKRNPEELDGFDETILPLDWRKEGHITDDVLNEILVESLPHGVKLTAVLDCCHSGTGMDLPFNFNSEKRDWDLEHKPKYAACDVVLFSGCQSDQTSADVNVKSLGAGGAMTFALTTALAAKPYGFTFATLMKQLEKVLKANRFKQKPQLSATQKFRVDSRPFHPFQIVANSNHLTGRDGKRVKKRAVMEIPRGVGLSDDEDSS